MCVCALLDLVCNYQDKNVFTATNQVRTLGCSIMLSAHPNPVLQFLPFCCCLCCCAVSTQTQ